MAFAMTLFVSAASGQLHSGRKPLTVKNRAEGVKLFKGLASVAASARNVEQDEDALDSDLFRAFTIVWEHYRNDRVQASIGARLLGFYHLMVRSRGKALEAWVEPSPHTEELVELHPSVIETIAKVELTSDGLLNEARFLSDLRFMSARLKVRPTPEGTGTWPLGKGEMANLVRAFNWASTPLGAFRSWPQSLRTAVDLALACRFPMVVLWGSDLIQIYNDGYCDLMGDKHPLGLGQPTRECWPEVWQINEPIYARVRAGETVTLEDELYPIRRHRRLENAYFTLCYSALRNEASEIDGILVTVFETTERVEAESRRSGTTALPNSGEG